MMNKAILLKIKMMVQKGLKKLMLLKNSFFVLQVKMK